MKSILILTALILTTSCGKIKVDEVKVEDSHHVVEHRIVFEADLGEATTICVDQYPEDVVKQQECLDGYSAAMDALAGLDQEVFSEYFDLEL